jgi:hypothetical protein
MTAGRLFAIFLIFVLATAGWLVLAGSVQFRTDTTNHRLGDQVSGLWGSKQEQNAPRFSVGEGSGKRNLEISGTDATVKFRLNDRRKGLLRYATYVADFHAAYTLKNPGSEASTATMTFGFPDSTGAYDGFSVRVNGTEVPVRYVDGEAIASFPLPAGKPVSVATGYRTNGLDSWVYRPTPEGVGVVKDFRLRMATDFGAIDYPGDGVSPTQTSREGKGWLLTWRYDSIVSGHPIGLVMPKPQNPGPLVARITAFAPVSLLFFFVALVLLVATSHVKLHPIHYGFLAAGFFAFHLLLAYLADQIDINLAFAVGALVSVALVMGYLRAVVGKSRVLFEIAASQLLFLVLFSYSFFFEGFTGLAITLGVVATLAYFMVKTAHVDWDEVFPRRQPRQPVAQYAPPQQWQQPVPHPADPNSPA